jgi:membrane protease YdiL (CAAX protease family)
MFRFLAIYAGMVVVAALLAAWTECPSLFLLPPSAGLLWASVAAAVLFSAVVVGGGRAMESVPWYRAMAQFLKRLLTSDEMLGPHLDSQRALVLALYSSVGEEALFRGFLQPWLIKHAGHWIGAPESLTAVAIGVVGASLIFGVLHFPVVKELIPWTLFAVGAGFVFGGLAAWSQSLVAPVLAHLLINWLNLKRITELPLDDAHPSGGPLT